MYLYNDNNYDGIEHNKIHSQINNKQKTHQTIKQCKQEQNPKSEWN